ncbi:MAG: cell division protein PerM [Microcella sp.]
MTRRATAFFSALEALLVVAAGAGVPLTVLTVMWAVQFEFQIDLIDLWKAGAIIWMLGHGVAVTIQLDAETVALLGLDGAGDPFTITLALTGFLLITALLGVRLGRRLREHPHRIIGELVAVTGVVGLSALIQWLVTNPGATPDPVQATLFPGLVYGLGLAMGSIGATNPARVRLRAEWARIPAPVRGVAGVVVRAGVAGVATVVAAGALLTTIALFVGFTDVIALYEGVQAGVLGGIALTLGQLALLPSMVIWTTSYLVGPGFALGAGSSVSPLGVSLGPVPAIPALGALPPPDFAPGFLVLLVPVVASFVAGVMLRERLLGVLGPDRRPEGWAALAGVLAGVVAGAVMAALAVLASGAAGPGRLALVGPDPVELGLWMLVIAAIATPLGLLAGGAKQVVAERLSASR